MIIRPPAKGRQNSAADRLASFSQNPILPPEAGMVELVDTRDLGSRALGRAGSTPVPGTSHNNVTI